MNKTKRGETIMIMSKNSVALSGGGDEFYISFTKSGDKYN